MKSQLVEAWRMGCEVNRYLLERLPVASLEDRYAPRTRTVTGQFAHIHNVRLRWLRHASPRHVGKAKSFPRGAEPGKKELLQALRASEESIARFLEQCEASGRVPRWNGPPATFLGYLLAHEAHHRGLAMVALRLGGHKPPDEVVYGQWDWGKKRSVR